MRSYHNFKRGGKRKEGKASKNANYYGNLDRWKV
jgi:hypothetical protein